MHCVVYCSTKKLVFFSRDRQLSHCRLKFPLTSNHSDIYYTLRNYKRKVLLGNFLNAKTDHRNVLKNKFSQLTYTRSFTVPSD